jgi:hypothetical protein
MVNDEHGRFVGWILDDVFLFSDPNIEARALAIRDLFFNMLGGQNALKMTNSVIAKGFNVVANH